MTENLCDLSIAELIQKYIKVNTEMKNRVKNLLFPEESIEILNAGLAYYNIIENQPEEDTRPLLNLDSGYLNMETLKIANRWKIRNQRNIRLIEENDERDIISSTKKAFSSNEDKIALKALCELRGISFPTASAILMFFDPKRFGVYDRRVTRVLHAWRRSDKRLKNGSLKDVIQYFEIIREMARTYSMTVREVDKALFGIDTIFGGKLD